MNQPDVTYDGHKNHRTSLPRGAKFARMRKFGNLPTPFYLQYAHNFIDDTVSPNDTLRFTVKLLLFTF